MKWIARCEHQCAHLLLTQIKTSSLMFDRTSSVEKPCLTILAEELPRNGERTRCCSSRLNLVAAAVLNNRQQVETHHTYNTVLGVLNDKQTKTKKRQADIHDKLVLRESSRKQKNHTHTHTQCNVSSHHATTVATIVVRSLPRRRVLPSLPRSLSYKKRIIIVAAANLSNRLARVLNPKRATASSRTTVACSDCLHRQPKSTRITAATSSHL